MTDISASPKLPHAGRPGKDKNRIANSCAGFAPVRLCHATIETSTISHYPDGTPDENTSAVGTCRAKLRRCDVGLVGGVSYPTLNGLSIRLRLHGGLGLLLGPAGASSTLRAHNDALLLQTGLPAALRPRNNNLTVWPLLF